jgi:ELWxxDGT repeat protein
MYGVETGAADAAGPTANQVASVTPVKGASPTISAPLDIKGVLFYGTAASGGGKLWETGGTGPKLLKTIKGKTAAPTELTNVGGRLYFEADGELWKSNGTAAGTVAVDTHVDPTAMANANGTLFFETPTALWKTRGAQATTRKLKTIKLGAKSEIVAVNGSVYFTDPKSGFNYDAPDLWTSDGTPAGTKTVLQTHIDPVYAKYPRLYDPTDLTNLNGQLFFEASTNRVKLSYTDLWRATAAKAATVVPYGTDLTNVNGSLYFFDYDKPDNCQYIDGGNSCSYSSGFALWKGSKALFNFDPTVYDGGGGGDTVYAPNVGQLTAVGGQLFFASNQTGKTELWRTDGTLAGLANVGALPPQHLTNVNGTLFFTANDGTHGSQIWESNGAAPAQDGTDAGIFAVTTFPAARTAPNDLVNVGGTLYFTANGGSAGGYGLWKLTP